jgi:predicted ester cyclase
VAYRWTAASGTHEGELMGIPPIGDRMTITGKAITRFFGGRIEEGWQNFDALGMMQQLGVIPTPGQAEEASST